MSRRSLGILLLVIAFGILGFVAYKNSPKRRVPIIFSPQAMLVTVWQNYKNEYLEPGSNRTLDKQKNNITTSEGESYTMLRAVWMDDKATYDNSLTWTKNNLMRSSDHLYSWLFGKKTDGSYGILTNQGGQNTATDADTDIALSLVFASARWNDINYLNDARAVIHSIWNQEVTIINGQPYIVANNLEKNASTTSVVVNPSYFSPYAYRIFAQIDPDPSRPWMKLVDSSYSVLEKSIDSSLDKGSSAGLPPDWILINRKTGEITAPSSSNSGNNLTTNFSFDALRIPWRIALDNSWNNEPRARNVLGKMAFLESQWKNNSLLYTSYSHDGNVVTQGQTAAMYGGTLGYYLVSDPETANVIYQNKLQILFDADTNQWKVKLGYYDDNWAWFGMALYNNALPNILMEAQRNQQQQQNTQQNQSSTSPAPLQSTATTSTKIKTIIKKK